ncbi:MAG TPA: helix-turn-helix domain-containing protein [Patescibacteria group bacterium]|nr:helix-turn-helix domain-containing protein [Patescibacteria group bacterium]
MDDLAVGRVFRALRLRLGWTQSMAAAKAGISRSSYSELERGWIDRVSIGKLRKIATIFEVRLVLEPRWRGAALDRAFSSRHAAMAEEVTRLLVGAGWEVRPEVSFNHFGERGVVDLVAWHGSSRTILLIELKTELADINNLLAVTDRRRRLAARIVEPFGWVPGNVAEWVVVAESRTNRRRAGEHRTVLRAAFPSDGRRIAGWLKEPREALAALWFLPDSGASAVRHGCAPRFRVRARSTSAEGTRKVA